MAARCLASCQLHQQVVAPRRGSSSSRATHQRAGAGTRLVAATQPTLCAAHRSHSIPRRRPGRSRLQVDAALFEPPPFQPRKLTVQHLLAAHQQQQQSQQQLQYQQQQQSQQQQPYQQLLPSRPRRYTLTHNDITGALVLSIGAEFNAHQVHGFYTRILRDEIKAEWLFPPASSTSTSSSSSAGGTSSTSSSTAAAAPAELHIYCHVSGEERWLAPPQLRNFIFRREMTLVLDTFLYGDRAFLQQHPQLEAARVYVHFQSDVQDLDLREFWGVLGDRASWRRMPQGVLARLKLLLFGFPAAPHQRPRNVLTRQQQQQQQQQDEQDEEGAVHDQQQQQLPAGSGNAVGAAAAAAAAGSATQPQHHPQYHPQAEQLVGATRPVALSLQEQRQAALLQQQQQQPAAAAGAQQLQAQAAVAIAAAPTTDEPGEAGEAAAACSSSSEQQQQRFPHDQQQLASVGEPEVLLSDVQLSEVYGSWSRRQPGSSGSGPRELAVAAAATASNGGGSNSGGSSSSGGSGGVTALSSSAARPLSSALQQQQQQMLSGAAGVRAAAAAKSSPFGLRQ